MSEGHPNSSTSPHVGGEHDGVQNSRVQNPREAEFAEVEEWDQFLEEDDGGLFGPSLALDAEHHRDESFVPAAGSSARNIFWGERNVL